MTNNYLIQLILTFSPCVIIILVLLAGVRLLRVISRSKKGKPAVQNRTAQAEKDPLPSLYGTQDQIKEEIARIEDSHQIAPQQAIYCVDTDLHTGARNPAPAFVREVYLVGKWVNTLTTDDSKVITEPGRTDYGIIPATTETKVYQFDTKVRVALHICENCLHKHAAKRALITRVMRIHADKNSSGQLKEMIPDMFFETGQAVKRIFGRVIGYTLLIIGCPLTLIIGFSIFLNLSTIKQDLTNLLAPAQLLTWLPWIILAAGVIGIILVVNTYIKGMVYKEKVDINLARSALNIVCPGSDVISARARRKRTEEKPVNQP